MMVIIRITTRMAVNGNFGGDFWGYGPFGLADIMEEAEMPMVPLT